MSAHKIRDATDLEIIYRRVCLLGETLMLPRLKEVYLSSVSFSLSLGTTKQIPIVNENTKKLLLDSCIDKEYERDIIFWTALVEDYYRENPKEMKGMYMDLLSQGLKIRIIHYINSLPHKTLICSHGTVSRERLEIIVHMMSLFPNKKTCFRFHPHAIPEDFKVKAKPHKKCFQITCLTSSLETAEEFFPSSILCVRPHYSLVDNSMGWTKIRWGFSFLDILKILESTTGTYAKFATVGLENLSHWLCKINCTDPLTHQNIYAVLSGRICAPFLDLAHSVLSSFTPTQGKECTPKKDLEERFFS